MLNILMRKTWTSVRWDLVCKFKSIRFIKNDQGTAVVEFSILGTFFIIMIGTIAQVMIVDIQSKNLDESLQRATRLIYTGKFQKDNTGATSQTQLSQLKKELCSGDNTPVFNCTEAKIDVTTSSSFSSSTSSQVYDPKTSTWTSGFGSNYTCGKPSTIMIVTAAVRQPMFLQIIKFGRSELGDGSQLIRSTVVFRTEPYDTSAGAPC